MMKTEVLPRTYATLRFAGDELDPSHISAILPVKPKRAHLKGESFFAGPHAGTLTGQTGLWYFDTRDITSDDLADHLRQIIDLLYPGGTVDRINRLRNVLDREHAKARVSCFWYGRHGAQPPVISDEVCAALARLPAEIEADVDTD